jgi:hypothetical protein
MGRKQKSYGDTFSPTPSLPMIRTQIAEYGTPDWEVRYEDLGNAYCDTPLVGDHYIHPKSPRNRIPL